MVILAYGALAHRRVYGNALWLSAIKVLVVLSIYLTMMLFGLLAVTGFDLWRTLA